MASLTLLLTFTCSEIVSVCTTLEELLTTAPCTLSEGKQGVVETSLRSRLDSVDSNYSDSTPRSSTPISQNDDLVFSPNRPLSPVTGELTGSSPRATEGKSSRNSSPHRLHEASSEPGLRDIYINSLSPPSSRRNPLRVSTNSAARPEVRLSPLASTCAAIPPSNSSPFRDSGKKYIRSRPNSENDLDARDDLAIRGKLNF